jgi:hypothetical protein
MQFPRRQIEKGSEALRFDVEPTAHLVRRRPGVSQAQRRGVRAGKASQGGLIAVRRPRIRWLGGLGDHDSDPDVLLARWTPGATTRFGNALRSQLPSCVRIAPRMATGEVEAVARTIPERLVLGARQVNLLADLPHALTDDG